MSAQPGHRPEVGESKQQMAISRFKRANPAPQGSAPAQSQTAPRARRFAGVEPQGQRDPMPYPGTYVFEVVDCVEGWNDGTKRKSYKISLRIAEIVNGGVDQPGTNAKHEVGEDVKAVMLETGPGMSEFKGFCMASAGFEVNETAEYDAWDVEPEGAQAGDHIEACLGEKVKQDGSENPFAKDGNPCVGTFVGATVSYTKPDGKGSFFRRYAWFVVETGDDGAFA